MSRSWAGRALAGAALWACVGATACGSGTERTGDPSLDVEVRVSPTPASTADTRVEVVATDGGAPLGSDAVVELAADGPGAPLPARALEARGAGRFASDGLRFSATGEWTLIVTVRTGDGRHAGFRRPVTVTGPPGEGG